MLSCLHIPLFQCTAAQHSIIFSKGFRASVHMTAHQHSASAPHQRQATVSARAFDLAQPEQKRSATAWTLSEQETLLCRLTALLTGERARCKNWGRHVYLHLPLHCACTALEACVLVVRPSVDPTPASTRRGA